MFTRFFITVGTFLAVFGCYLVYGWILVPRVLPEVKEMTRPIAVPEVRDEQDKFAFLFSTNDWERTAEDLKILQTPEMVVLFQNREFIQDTKIKVSPCTILLLPNDATLPEPERLRQSIMIRTLDYAMLEADGPIESASTGPIKFKRGDMAGRVTITSDMQEIGPHDDLSVVAQDVILTVQPALTTISSFHDVKFRLAKNHGEGRDITIELVSNPRDPKSPKTLNKIQLLNLKELNLAADSEIADAVSPSPGNQAPPPRNTAPRNTAPKNADAKSKPNENDGSTIRITCKQDFLLHPDPNSKKTKNWIAQFRDEVHVVCTHPDKTQDMIDCGQLMIYLRPKPTPPAAQRGVAANAAPSASNKPDDLNALGDLEIAQILAMWSPAKPAEAGKPAKSPQLAVLRSPSNEDFQAIGERILYDLQRNRVVVLKERPELPPVRISAKKGQFSINAASVVYQMGQERGFEFLTATGGGNLNGILGGEDAPKKFTCSWNSLDLRPDPKNPVQLLITLNEKVKAEIETVGTMQAQTALFWCTQRPRSNTSNTLKNAAPGTTPDTAPAPVSTAKNPAPGAPASPLGDVDLIPDRAQVFGNVEFVTASGTCQVKQMDIFFCETPAGVSINQQGDPPDLFGAPRSPVSPGPSDSRPRLLQGPHDIQAPRLSAARTTTRGGSGITTAGYTTGHMVDRDATNEKSVRQTGDVSKNAAILQVQHSQPRAPASPRSPAALPRPAGHQTVPVSPAVPATSTTPAAPPTLLASPATAPLESPPGQLSRSRDFLFGSSKNGERTSTFSVVGEQLYLRIRLASDAAESGTNNASTATQPGVSPPPSSVEQFRIVGDVTIKEKILIGLPDHAMTISGKEIHVWEPDTEATEIKIIGDPVRRAVFQGKGIELVSSNINISRPNNRLWIVGEGQLNAEIGSMSMPELLDAGTELSDSAGKDRTPIARVAYKTPVGASPPANVPPPTSSSPARLRPLNDAAQTPGAPNAAPTRTAPRVVAASTPTTTPKETVFVRWNQGMQFDGNILYFEGKRDIHGQGVKVFTKNQNIYAQTVSIYLNRFFSFFDDTSAEEIGAETIDCTGAGGIGGNLLIENEQHDETGRLKSRDEAECARLLIHVPSTQFQLQGPGRLSSRFLANESGGGLEGFGALAPGSQPAKQSKQSNQSKQSQELTLVDVSFHDHVLGNQSERVLRIAGQIRCVHCPLAGWDEVVDVDNLNEIAKRGFHLSCDLLNIVQMYEPDSSVELTASGNSRIEGNGYYAKAETMRYNQAKDLVNLDGSGFSDAQLFSGTETRTPIEAQGIDYNVKTGHVSIRGFRGARIGGF